MRNLRLLPIAISAAGTFALALALGLPATLDAVNQPPATPMVPIIETPKLVVNGIEFTVKEQNPSTQPAAERSAAVKPPLKLSVVARNVSISSAKADFTVQVTATTTANPLSRALPEPKEIWKATNTIALNIGESKTLDFTTCDLPANQVIAVNLSSGTANLSEVYAALAATTRPSFAINLAAK